MVVIKSANAVIWVVVISGVIAVVLSIFMMAVALEHNPMGEFCEWVAPMENSRCVIQWDKLSFVGMIWLIPSFVLSVMLGYLLNFAIKYANKLI